MKSISKATTDLGLISFSLVRQDGILIAENGRAVKILASSTENLLEILETLYSLPVDPVIDLPRGFGSKTLPKTAQWESRGRDKKSPAMPTEVS